MVIAPIPGPATRSCPAGTIDAVVSKGPERFQIPKNIKGMTLEAATAALKQHNLEVEDTKEVYDEKVEEGRVVGPLNHTYDDLLKRGDGVVLGISKGPKPIKVEDYRGRPFDEAKKALEDAGFKVESSEVFSKDVDKGDVVSQTPHDGTKAKGDTITMTVSKGPEQVEVPDLVGKSRKDATKLLKDAGFKVTAFGAGNFTVKAQNPPAGPSAPRAATSPSSASDPCALGLPRRRSSASRRSGVPRSS